MPNAFRPTMEDLILETRQMIGDPWGATPQFSDVDIQTKLDRNRQDVRYEPLTIAPTIVNLPSTNNQASVIFADYYSKFQWWEADVVLQGIDIPTNAPYKVLTPVSSDLIVGHWTFEASVFTSGTAPGQYPPIFATGKVYDLYRSAAELLKVWAASLSGAYDISVDGQSLRRSQLMTAKLMMAEEYLKMSKPKIAKLERSDVLPDIGSRRMRLLDSGDTVK